MSTRRPFISRGPASHYAGSGEAIYEFSDGASGGLLSLRRIADGRLLVDVYRTDPDVIVRAPRTTPVRPISGRPSKTLDAPEPDDGLNAYVSSPAELAELYSPGVPMPAGLRADLRALLDYDWQTEERDYEANPDERHVFRSIQRLSAWLDETETS